MAFTVYFLYDQLIICKEQLSPLLLRTMGQMCMYIYIWPTHIIFLFEEKPFKTLACNVQDSQKKFRHLLQLKSVGVKYLQDF